MTVEQGVFAQTSVLKLTFQTEGPLRLGIFRDAVPNWNTSEFPNNFETEVLQYDV